MFKKEVAQRAARVMGNVIREPISKKDHELMQSYLKGPRQMSPQECNWNVPTEKMTDLTREMRNVGIAGDGYMNFKDIIHGIRKAKGLGTWEDLKPAKDLERQEMGLDKHKSVIPDFSFNKKRLEGETPLDDYHHCHNNRQLGWKNITKRWINEYSDRAGEKPFVLGYQTSIADLKRDDKMAYIRDVSSINARGLGVGHKQKKAGGKKK